MELYLVDTNVLLRSTEPAHSLYQDSVFAISKLQSQGDKLHIFPQNVYEFWNVNTRPASKNGLGKTPTETEREVQRLEILFPVLPDGLAVLAAWRNLVITHSVLGVQVHDARLVAAMQIHGLTHILTFNDTDFLRYPGITVVNPSRV